MERPDIDWGETDAFARVCAALDDLDVLDEFAETADEQGEAQREYESAEQALGDQAPGGQAWSFSISSSPVYPSPPQLQQGACDCEH